MLKLFKYLRKSIVSIIAVAILLIIQVNCDLALPTYTSDIVNVGIMNGGVDRAVPKVLRQSEFDKIVLFMTKEEKASLLTHYTLWDQTKSGEADWSDYVSDYPLLKSESLYIWDGKDLDLIETILAAPILLTYGIESGSEQANTMKEQLLAGMPPQMVTDEMKGMDLFTLLAMFPEENRTAAVAGMRDYVEKMPEMMVSQTGLAYLKAEYQAIGINVNHIQTNYIFQVGGKMILLALLSMFVSVIVTLLASRVAARMGRDLRGNVFHKVLAFSNTEMDHFSTASLITRSTNDIQQVQMLVVMMIRIVIYAPLLAFGGIAKVLHTNSSMTWVLAVGVGAILTLIGVLLIITMPKFKMMQKLVDRINLVMREILTGLPVIRAFSTEEHEKKRFDKANVDLTKTNLFVSRVMTLLMPALMLIMNLISILIIWVSANKINDGAMQIGDMIAFIQYTMQIIMSFLLLTMISIILPRAAVAAKRIDEVLSEKISIEEPSQAENFKSNKGLLEFHNVSFRYPNAQEDVLSGIDFIAKPGETTAIIGSTGSGKSTLINLIPRFYDITAGSIFIDGVDIRKVKQHDLREKLGYVPQKGVLFSGSIATNIKFGNPEESDEVMQKAARIAQAAEFIEAKDDKYEAPISQGGSNVSGGQKQRLSIARAIAKDPEIYIFDDSFSALDYKTDAVLRKTLKEELSDRTILIVAQRISTIMSAEQILVLDDGRIVGKGTHKELLQNCEVYQQIASSQLSKEELEQ